MLSRFAKCLLSSLHPEVYVEISGYIVTMAPFHSLLCSLLLWGFVGNTLLMFSTPNMTYPIEQRVKLLYGV